KKRQVAAYHKNSVRFWNAQQAAGNCPHGANVFPLVQNARQKIKSARLVLTARNVNFVETFFQEAVHALPLRAMTIVEQVFFCSHSRTFSAHQDNGRYVMLSHERVKVEKKSALPKNPA